MNNIDAWKYFTQTTQTNKQIFYKQKKSHIPFVKYYETYLNFFIIISTHNITFLSGEPFNTYNFLLWLVYFALYNVYLKFKFKFEFILEVLRLFILYNIFSITTRFPRLSICYNIKQQYFFYYWQLLNSVIIIFNDLFILRKIVKLGAQVHIYYA